MIEKGPIVENGRAGTRPIRPDGANVWAFERGALRWSSPGKANKLTGPKILACLIAGSHDWRGPRVIERAPTQSFQPMESPLRKARGEGEQRARPLSKLFATVEKKLQAQGRHSESAVCESTSPNTITSSAACGACLMERRHAIIDMEAYFARIVGCSDAVVVQSGDGPDEFYAINDNALRAQNAAATSFPVACPMINTLPRAARIESGNS